MKKLLTICIPTYKRPDTLRRCIESIVAQIEKYKLSDCVDIYVTNDASPDDTVSVLHAYASLNYFNGITREQNLGMNVNIKRMLTDVAKKSSYQLIITDDDYLQPDILDEIVEFLREQQNDSNRAPAIWTPRYSYTEDGKLHGVVCNPFKDSFLVKPSAANAGKYMSNGFVLSGLILRAEYIDYEFWEQYRENAYFPIIFLGDLLFRSGAYYWNNNIVHHTVLNECHWERWGKNDVVINMRLFADCINAYGIMAGRINKHLKVASFYFSSFSSVRNELNSFLLSEKFKGDRPVAIDAINELKVRGVLEFNFQLRLLMVCALPWIVVATFKSILRHELALLVRGKQKKGHYRKAISVHFRVLKVMPIMLKIILG
jgi:glycosyltransferase involved in cell wall biosynthesis